MSLTKKINKDLKSAMRNKNQGKMRTLRSIKNELIKASREKGAEGEVPKDKELSILQKMAKQRKESIDIYKEQDRQDLLEEEKAELQLIEKYLPEQLSEGELKKEVEQIIEETGAESMEDMGQVMGQAMQKLKGKAQGKRVSDMVKSLLS
jgi:uncharacterized protein YqeY